MHPLHLCCATEQSVAVDNGMEDGLAEDSCERSRTVRQPKLAATRVLGESNVKHTSSDTHAVLYILCTIPPSMR